MTEHTDPPPPQVEPEAHTELRRAGQSGKEATTLKPRTPLEAIPNPIDDDGLDDLFNDMPV